MFCLPNKLKELRGTKSQQEFAQEIGVKQTSYSSWERGVKDPAAKTVAQIANTFGVSADWLLGLEDSEAQIKSIGQESNCDTCPYKIKYKKIVQIATEEWWLYSNSSGTLE